MKIFNNIIEHINTREELSSLTDRDLRDIGLTRYDVDTYYKTTLGEEVKTMFTKIKNFIINAVSTWRETIAMRDKVLAKYKHIGS